MFRQPSSISQETMDSCRRVYEAGDQSLAFIAHRLGVSRRTLGRLARTHGWRRWKANASNRPDEGETAGSSLETGPPDPDPQGDPRPLDPDRDPADRAGLARRLERLVAGRIAALEAAAATGDDPERIARAVASYARSLEAIGKIAGKAGTGTEGDESEHAAEPPPKTLAQLRDELHGHLVRIRHEERDRRASRKAQPG